MLCRPVNRNQISTIKVKGALVLRVIPMVIPFLHSRSNYVVRPRCRVPCKAVTMDSHASPTVVSRCVGQHVGQTPSFEAVCDGPEARARNMTE